MLSLPVLSRQLRAGLLSGSRFATQTDLKISAASAALGYTIPKGMIASS